MHIFWIIPLVIFIGIGGWQLIVLAGETRDKSGKFRAAKKSARQSGKPLLVVGGPWGGTPFRRLLKIPAHDQGDICLDIHRRAIKGHPLAMMASVTHIPVADKAFGAVIASHVLEHMPTTEIARKAMEELNRVSEAVYIVCPSRQSIAGWLIPDHRIWVWQDGEKTYLKQRRTKDCKVEVLTPESIRRGSLPV